MPDILLNKTKKTMTVMVVVVEVVEVMVVVSAGCKTIGESLRENKYKNDMVNDRFQARHTYNFHHFYQSVT